MHSRAADHAPLLGKAGTLTRFTQPRDRIPGVGPFFRHAFFTRRPWCEERAEYRRITCPPASGRTAKTEAREIKGTTSYRHSLLWARGALYARLDVGIIRSPRRNDHPPDEMTIPNESGITTKKPLLSLLQSVSSSAFNKDRLA